jgi:uncharacterized membrane protein YidH (DUF202 family)
MIGNAHFDPGLQPERTALAWRRTALALAAGALVAVRLLPPVLGLWSLAAALAGTALAGVIWVLAGRRARRTREALRHPAAPLPGAGLLLLLALIAAAAAVLSLLYIAASLP